MRELNGEWMVGNEILTFLFNEFVSLNSLDIFSLQKNFVYCIN